LKPGVTTRAEIKTLFGDPDTRSSETTATLTSEEQIFHHRGGTQIFLWRIAELRMLALELQQDVLKGYLYLGGIGSNQATYDPAKLAEIKQGVTTRQQAIELLGQPSGEMLAGTRHKNMREEFDPGVKSILLWTSVEGMVGMVWSDVKVRAVQLKLNGQDRVVSVKIVEIGR
jgi:hypothetical protein